MKLLNRSIRAYLLYSFIIVLIAAPVFYLVIQQIVYEEVDEGIVAQKEEIIQQLNNLPADAQPPLVVGMDLQLAPSSVTNLRDSFYNVVAFDKISKEHIPYRVLKTAVKAGEKVYVIQLKRSLIDNEDLIQSIVFVMMIMLLLIVAGFLIINRLTSKKIWGPFYSTVNKLALYELGKNEIPEFEKTNVDEFTDLNKSIDILIKKNVSIFQSQKEFTENAAHEMQTPLAILQGKLELLMQTQPLNEEQGTLIGDIADASQRMNRLNRSLLLLTKIENNPFVEKEKISLPQTVCKIVDQFKLLAEQKNISILEEHEPETIVEVNRTVLEIVITNLITNAIRHTPANGRIITGTYDNAELMIANTAEKGALDTSRLFQRFQKDSSDNNSTGLGLAIVARICSLYNLTIHYSHADNMHVFSVKFKPR